MSQRLSNSSGKLGEEYATVVIGSGYGGSIIAARLAEQGKAVCLLERGKEWRPGDFPDQFKDLAGGFRSKHNPLGLVDYYLCKDIDVLKGSGLGGTSLVNLNVAFRPDAEFYDDPRWPKIYRDLAESGKLWDYYERAEKALGANPHPDWQGYTKIQRMKQRADQLRDADFHAVNVTVNFGEARKNHFGVTQEACIDCGDCFPGCNVGAKGTLAMNYLPYAKAKGAEIYTQIDVRWIEKSAAGYTVVYRYNTKGRHGKDRRLQAKNVVLAAGAVGSTEILLRSAAHGLTTSGCLGDAFNGNGDYLGLGYNSDHRTDVMGYGNRPDSKRAQVKPGTTIMSAIQYDRSGPWKRRITVEDFTVVPSALVDTYRRLLPGLTAALGKDTDQGFRDKMAELARVGQDQLAWSPNGALNHSMLYLAMAIDDGRGKIRLNRKDKVTIDWPSIRTDPIFQHVEEELLAHAKTLGATYVHLDRVNPWSKTGSNLITAHPLGGCPMGEDASKGVTDPDARVYDGEGGVHDGLFVVDGAVVPLPIGVNPFLTISAIAERVAERMPGLLAG